MTYFILAGIFKKLNYKLQPVLHVLEAAKSFNTQLTFLDGKAVIERHADGEIYFAIGFVQLTDKLDQMVHAVAPKLVGESYLLDRLSGGDIGRRGHRKVMPCHFIRDRWEAMGSFGVEVIK